MSSKDMALINHIPELIELGVNSFKIEGRMKSLHYIATVVSTYRKLIDDYCKDPDNFVMSDKYYQELLKAANRALCTGFFDNQADNNKQIYNQRDEHPTQEFCARVIGYDESNQMAIIEQRNYFKLGDQIEFFSPSHENVIVPVEKIINEENEEVSVANHPMEILKLPVCYKLKVDDMGRRITK